MDCLGFADAMVSGVFAQVGAADQGGRYSSSNGTWTLQLPSGWKVMTPELLAALDSAAGAVATKTGGSVRYSAGFHRGQPGSQDWSWVLVEQLPYARQGKLPDDLTPLFGFDQVEGVFRSLEPQGISGTLLSMSGDNRTGRGTIETEMTFKDRSRVRGRSEVLVGSRGTLSVSGYASSDVWSKYEPDVVSLLASAQFSPGHDLASAQRGGGGLTSSLMGRVAGLALLAALVIWIVKKVTGR